MSVGEYREQRSYGEILRLGELLDVAHAGDEEVDRALFLATHQSCEIWFALILTHLESVRARLEVDDGPGAVQVLRRLSVMVGLLVGHFDVLSMLSPEAFGKIRTELGSASGLQSAQYREIEYLCGPRDRRHLATPGFSPVERERLRQRIEQRSVSEAYRDFRRRRSAVAGSGAGRDEVEPVRLALLDLDEALMVWRSRHAALAERFLGGLSGTAGSEGAAYLWQAARLRMFADVWPNS